VLHSNDLIRIHLALECITVNEAGDLTRLSPCDNPDDIARLYVARHGDGYTVFFRHDVPAETRARLLTLSPQQLHTCHDEVRSILSADAPCPEDALFVGKSYVYPEIDSPTTFPDVLYHDFNECVIEIEGKVVSACSSSREDAVCGEAWVRTEPEYQRRGFARRVTLAWAHRLRAQGKIPFYSHKITNLASQRVAEALGFRWYIDDIAYP
jgi:GNAT superfamily N-acetyltransferase